MVGIVYLLNGLCHRQLLEKIGRAVINPVDVAEIAVIRLAHVGVEAATGLAHRLCPVVAGIVGVLPRHAVQDSACALAANQGAIRIPHIPAHGRLAVPGIFRGAQDFKGRGLAALSAGKCFDSDHGIGVQLVGTVICLFPVFSGIVVAVLLGGKGRGDQGEHDGYHKQQGRQPPGGMVMNVQFAPPKCDLEMEKALGTKCLKGLLLQIRRFLRRLLFLPLVQ